MQSSSGVQFLGHDLDSQIDVSPGPQSPFRLCAVLCYQSILPILVIGQGSTSARILPMHDRRLIFFDRRIVASNSDDGLIIQCMSQTKSVQTNLWYPPMWSMAFESMLQYQPIQKAASHDSEDARVPESITRLKSSRPTF
jgi:hypothetical protein